MKILELSGCTFGTYLLAGIACLDASVVARNVSLTESYFAILLPNDYKIPPGQLLPSFYIRLRSFFKEPAPSEYDKTLPPTCGSYSNLRL